MTLAVAEKALLALERAALEVDARIKARAATGVALPGDKLARLDKALGGAQAATAFLARMPAKPGAEAILDAFGGSPAKLGVLANTVLGGDLTLLGVLAAKGCKGDPAKLVALCDQFAGDPKPLQDLLHEGGLASHPETLAAILQQGCDANPARLAEVCTTFAAKDDRARLAATLEVGGLGRARWPVPRAKACASWRATSLTRPTWPSSTSCWPKAA